MGKVEATESMQNTLSNHAINDKLNRHEAVIRDVQITVNALNAMSEQLTGRKVVTTSRRPWCFTEHTKGKKSKFSAMST